ncbi:MAG: glycosyltransferase [Candidatus Micrarchaeota archaeon]|nr:glycosyltransferase [Candidatus Micrarchaeota archaeon]
MTPEVSVVIPTIEEESIFEVIEGIRKLIGNNVEIIIVDKSSDAYFHRLEKTNATVLRQKDKGVENAIMLGLRHAHGKIIASIDADGTHDVSGIPEGIKLVKNGSADLVLGSRLSNLEEGSMSFYLKFGNSLISWLFRRAYKAKVHDVLTGLFVMSRKAFDDIRDVEPYRAGIAFFAIELARKGYKIKEVNIAYYKRAHGESKLTKSKFAYGVNVSSHIIRQIRDYSPLLLFGGIGLVAILVGLVIGVQILINFLGTGIFYETGRALLAFGLVVVGFFLIIAGLMLDILVEIEKKLSKR